MTISTRTDFEAALKRQAQLQREASTDPEKQRQLRELSDDIQAYRRNNPAEAGKEGTPPPLGAPAEDKSGVYDPHNELNLNTAAPPGLNDQSGAGAQPKETARSD